MLSDPSESAPETSEEKARNYKSAKIEATPPNPEGLEAGALQGTKIILPDEVKTFEY